MGYTIRQMEDERNFCQEVTVEALQRAVPREAIAAVLAETGNPVQRARKLTAEATIWTLIVMKLYTLLALGHVLRKLAQGLRFIWPDPTYRVPGASAFVYRRYQLGAAPLVALYERVARPIATPQTPGAFRFGLRLMAIDGTVEEVPDTPANAAAFGRQHGSRRDSAFPQVQGVYLVECGTHAIVDATFGPYGTSERAGARPLLRALTADMVVLWDRGFHDYDLDYDVLCALRRRGAHVVGRLPACASRSGAPPCPTARRWPTCAPPTARGGHRGTACSCASLRVLRQPPWTHSGQPLPPRQPLRQPLPANLVQAVDALR